MLDPAEVADYEAWKERRLVGQTDLSVAAYNMELEAHALAFEDGVRAAINPAETQKILEILEQNPYRKPGMNGYRGASSDSSVKPIGTGPRGRERISAPAYEDEAQF